jgi:fructose-1,6-bisphosphatase I
MSEQTFRTLGEFIIEKQEDFKYSSGELSRLISAIRLASKVVNREVNKAGIANIIGQVGNQNIQGEDQQKLDVLANNIFIEALFSVKLFAELPPKKATILSKLKQPITLTLANTWF